MVHDNYLHTLSQPITLAQYFKTMLTYSPKEYLELRIKLGLIFINFEQAISSEQLLKEGDYFSSITHYHERPVLDDRIEIIHEDDDLVVVNKPASIVVYPISGYRLNSLTYILAKEMGFMNLRPIHRLDKLTSGVMIFSKVNLSL